MDHKILYTYILTVNLHHVGNNFKYVLTTEQWFSVDIPIYSRCQNPQQKADTNANNYCGITHLACKQLFWGIVCGLEIVDGMWWWWGAAGVTMSGWVAYQGVTRLQSPQNTSLTNQHHSCQCLKNHSKMLWNVKKKWQTGMMRSGSDRSIWNKWSLVELGGVYHPMIWIVIGRLWLFPLLLLKPKTRDDNWYEIYRHSSPGTLVVT